MTMHETRSISLGRRGVLRAAGVLAGVGAVAALGGASAFAQQVGLGGKAVSDPGAGGMPGGGMMAQSMQMMAGMMPDLTGPDADRTLIREMIPHHQLAVAMATVAWQQAEHPEIKQVTETIVKTQNEEIEQMARWYRAWYGSDVPAGQMAAMSAQMGMTADALRGVKPSDKAFIEMMTMHHSMAIMMATPALRAYQREELGKMEQTIITDQAKEINQMRTWYRTWYGG